MCTAGLLTENLSRIFFIKACVKASKGLSAAFACVHEQCS
jgi:hypothetical protein